MWDFVNRSTYDTTTGGMAIREYADYAEISEYALEAMAWANAKGLITGDGGTLNPQGAATRAQVATIFMRFIENIIE